MKKIKECSNYYIFDNVKEFIKKVNIDKLGEKVFNEYPYCGWSDYVEEYFIEILKYFGFEEIETCWDVSYSQGSGASFTAEWCSYDINIEELKKYAPDDKEIHKIAEQLEDLISESTIDCNCFDYNNPEEECEKLYEYYKDKKDCEKQIRLYYAKVKRFNHHYCHKNTVEVECYSAEDERLDDIEYYFNDIVRELSDLFYNRLTVEYNYLISDEGIAEYYTINEIPVEEKYLKKEYINEFTTNN